MKASIVALLFALASIAHAGEKFHDVVYKCVKDGKTTYQEMPCGWSALGPEERKHALQVIVPFSQFCSDKSISEKNSLKQSCPKVTLTKDRK